MLFDYSFNITALTFIAILTVYYNVSPIFPNRANKLFSEILIEGTISVFLDVLTFFCINNKVNIYINYTVNMLFFISQWIIPYLLFKYVVVLTKYELKINYYLKTLPVLLLVINFSLLLSSPITHYVFYFDENLNYIRGSLFGVSILIESSILLIGLLYVIAKRKYLSLSQVLIIPSFITINILATYVQIRFPEISIISASICVSIFLMYITLLKPASYIDSVTNLYNRMAFDEYIYALNSKKIPFSFIVVDIVGTTKINNLISENFGNQVIKRIGEELNLITNNCLLFRIDGDKFLIISSKDKAQHENLNRIQEHFPMTIKNNEISLEIKVHIAYSEKLTDIRTTTEMIDLTNFICAKAKEEKTTQKLNLSIINEYRYKKKRDEAILKAIETENIEIKLQPIFDTKLKEFNSAEALCRINTKEFGYINPSIFINYAEKKGIISQLSLTMIKKVCQFLSYNSLPKNFKNISINLSVIDCLDPNIQQKILNIIDQYKIDKKMISFEVTETTASIAPQLERTMMILGKENITFSMDDFGTGYANLDSVLRLPFATAKIDRALLNLAQESEKYKVLISSLINMIKKLDLEIIVEGIETEEQIAFLSKLDVDYYQGFYYSMPLSTEEFITFIRANSNK
ncbi:MAG: EAL domain-containing protein [Pleomorphochaeta sp.]